MPWRPGRWVPAPGRDRRRSAAAWGAEIVTNAWPSRARRRGRRRRARPRSPSGRQRRPRARRRRRVRRRPRARGRARAPARRSGAVDVGGAERAGGSRSARSGAVWSFAGRGSSIVGTPAASGRPIATARRAQRRRPRRTTNRVAGVGRRRAVEGPEAVGVVEALERARRAPRRGSTRRRGHRPAAAEHLGREVGERAPRGRRRRARLPSRAIPKSRTFTAPSVVTMTLRGRDVAMHDAAVVRMGERATAAAPMPGDPARRRGSPLGRYRRGSARPRTPSR